MGSIKNLVNNPHRVYTKYFDYWNFLLESYEGGIDYTDAYIKHKSSDQVEGFNVKVNGKALQKDLRRNLFAHPKERSDDYRKRIDMSFYYNFCAPIIDIYSNHLFKSSVIEDYGAIDGLVAVRDSNIDLKGSSIAEFRKILCETTQIYGHCFVLVDSPKTDGEILSLADKYENGIFPYFNIIPPQNVINWALDKFGRPHWVLVAEVSDGNVDPFDYKDNESLKLNYRLWTREEWILFDDSYSEIGRSYHNLGVVPIIPSYERKSRKEEAFLGISQIADIAFISRDIYNSCSELKQILRDQTFSILALQGEASDFPIQEVATNKGILYPRDTAAPVYVTPPPGPADTLMRHIELQISRIFQIAKLEGGSASYNGQSAVMQSGTSKAWDFNQTNSALSMKAGNLEDCETRLWDVWARWEGKLFDGMIQYPKDFNVKSLSEDLEEAEKIMKLDISSTFDQEVKKAIVKKKFPRLPDEDIDKITAEIETPKSNGVRLADRINNITRTTNQIINNGNSPVNGGLTNGTIRNN